MEHDVEKPNVCLGDKAISWSHESANLNIKNEEWSYLVETDLNLTKQIGCFLLEHIRQLEMIITSNEASMFEQQAMTNHHEKQIQYLRETLEIQTKIYEELETQVEELTKNYREISKECCLYKERNNLLWRSIENLERVCEEYATEIENLKSRDVCKQCHDEEKNFNLTRCPNPANMTITVDTDDVFKLDSDIIPLRAFSEETSRKLELERIQRVQLEKRLHFCQDENDNLKQYVTWLEHRLRNEQNEPMTRNLSPQTTQIIKSKSMVSLIQNDIDSKSEENYRGKIAGNEKEYLSFHDKLERPSSHRHYEGEKPPLGLVSPELTISVPSAMTCKCGHTQKPKLASEKPGATLVNYRQMFAEIFEKLKMSREIIEEQGVSRVSTK